MNERVKDNYKKIEFVRYFKDSWELKIILLYNLGILIYFDYIVIYKVL